MEVSVSPAGLLVVAAVRGCDAGRVTYGGQLLDAFWVSRRLDVFDTSCR